MMFIDTIAYYVLGIAIGTIVGAILGAAYDQRQRDKDTGSLEDLLSKEHIDIHK